MDSDFIFFLSRNRKKRTNTLLLEKQASGVDETKRVRRQKKKVFSKKRTTTTNDIGYLHDFAVQDDEIHPVLVEHTLIYEKLLKSHLLNMRQIPILMFSVFFLQLQEAI